MPTRDERQQWLNEFARSRGYAHRMHRVLVNYDLDVLKAVNPVPVGTYVTRRTLDDGLKEILLVVTFSALRSARYIIESHTRKALAFGVPPRQLLEALEMIVLDAGRPAFEEGVLAWAAVMAEEGRADATRIEETGMAKQSDSAVDGGEGTGGAPERAFEPILRRHDAPIQALIERMSHSVYLRPRTLDARTKELITIVTMTALKVPDYLLKAHIRRALEVGVSKEEVLEALELIITVTGLPVFEHGLMAWADVVDAEEMQPEGAVFSRLPSEG